MSLHRRARLSALLAAAAVTLATLVPAFPAAAEDQPPAPEVTATAEPTTDPTPETTTEPSTEPSADPSEAPAASATTTELTGEFVDLSDDDPSRALPTGVRTFHATGVGYLLISGAPATGTATVTITVDVPAGVDAGDSQALIDYSVEHPLALLSSEVAQATAQMVNQTPTFTAVHKIYAVLLTPNNVGGGAASNQTATEAAALTAHVDDYWSQQSGGLIHFALAGTTAFHTSTNTCTTDAGSTAIWNQAAGFAATELGYTDAPNNHLVVIFPSNTNCGGPIGLGTIGRSANVGGRLWTIGGTGIEIRKATLAHELGHNLSFGHADWLRCPTAVPTLGTTGLNGSSPCALKNYGDLTDVMGYGQDGFTGGALSSPQAIRAGIWPSTAYKFQPKGTTSYTLAPVSGNAGLRSVIVEDNQGVSYFVEFRNNTGEDNRAAPQCATSYCVTTNPGVRILRLEEASGYKGMPGDDSYLIGRTVAGVDRIDYLTGESFSSGGITVKVTSVNSAAAKITVTRNFTKGVLDAIDLWPAVVWSTSEFHVGDTWGVFLGNSLIADSEKFQWYRNGSKISGATKQFYTFTNADYAKTISVKVTIASKGYTSATGGGTLGVIQKAVQTSTGTVTVPGGTAPLKATPAGFPWGTTFTYQWYRDATKITGATTSTYTPVAADANHQVKVTVTPTSAGNPLAAVSSAGYDYRLDTTGVFGITGTEKVGNTLTAPNVDYQSTTPSLVSVTRKYQWYRKTGTAAPVAITGATNATYALVGTDSGKTISVRVIASAPGFVSNATTTAPTGVIAAGKIQGTLVGPNITKTGTTPTTIKLTAAPQSGSVTEPGVTYTYQWFRSVPAGTPELAISGATKSSYILTSADYDKLVWLKITVKKAGYGSEVLESGHQNYSVTSTDSPVIAGTAQVGEFVHAELFSYGAIEPSAPPIYTWYRGTTVVQNTEDNYYQVKAADVGSALKVRVTASSPGFLPMIKTSPVSAVVIKGAFSGTLEANVLENARVLTANPSGVVPAPTYLYQWLRNGAVITGATKVTYTLTTADYNKSITVKITATKAGYTSLPPLTTATSTFSNYSVLAEGVPSIVGDTHVGQPLSVNLPSYTVFGVGTSPSPIAYQWYRKTGTAAAVAISGATSPIYVLASGDLNKTISVRVTAGYVSGSFDLLPSVLTTAQTTKVLAALP